MSLEEKLSFDVIHKNNIWLCLTVDVAHVIGKGNSLKNKYNPDNAILLTRLVHSSSEYGLDCFKDPFTGKSIKKEIRDNWFHRIVGNIP